jgi:hypothetical protein
MKTLQEILDEIDASISMDKSPEGQALEAALKKLDKELAGKSKSGK